MWGLNQLLAGDLSMVVEYWRVRPWLLPLVLLLACVDVLLEGVGWAWVYRRFGLPGVSRDGAFAYLSGRAGLLLPAQLGRLIRPEEMARLTGSPISQCLKAEAVAFALDAASVVALIGGLVTFRFYPLLAPFAVLGIIGSCLVMGNFLANRPFGQRLSLPPSLWWNWQTWAIVLVQSAGWAINGLALWVMIRGLQVDLATTDVMLFSAASAVLGVGTGLPGGVGATEWMLGASLSLGAVSPDHLFLVIGAFRLATFWIWIPLGWAALLVNKRRLTPEVSPDLAAESVSTREPNAISALD